MILWGRPKGAKAPPLDQGNRSRDGSGQAGHSPRFPGPLATTLRAGERCSPGQEGTGKGSLGQGSLVGRGASVPCEGRQGGRGSRGELREWGSLSGAYSCGPGGQPEWPSQTPPAPPPWSWLSTQGSQRH
uniref:Rho-related GTP-binding protein RhoC isoform X1 n=1 Tax=Sus scrofa TaxID=9823 RepID=A0A480IMB8_PIG